MKGLNLIVLLAVLTSLVACSNNRKKAKDANQVAESTSSTLTDDADFIVDSEDEDLLLADESGTESFGLTPQPAEPAADPLLADSFAQDSMSAAPMIATSGNMGSYTVEAGDTLMLVAFKLYGDYRKWREIAQMNPGVNGERLAAGSVLSYDMPVQRFEWTPKGLPYLVKRGDTLGTISNDKYGTIKRWREIYDNNQPMIRDPNLIFAGFTLYYQTDRDVASEKY